MLWPRHSAPFSPRDLTYPLGKSEAHRFIVGLGFWVEDTFWKLLAPEDANRTETTGEVPIIRDGQRTYENLDSLTLRDLPTILNTFVVLEEELGEHDESERKAAERKARERIRARERRIYKEEGRTPVKLSLFTQRPRKRVLGSPYPQHPA